MRGRGRVEEEVDVQLFKTKPENRGKKITAQKYCLAVPLWNYIETAAEPPSPADYFLLFLAELDIFESLKKIVCLKMIKKIKTRKLFFCDICNFIFYFNVSKINHGFFLVITKL